MPYRRLVDRMLCKTTPYSLIKGNITMQIDDIRGCVGRRSNDSLMHLGSQNAKCARTMLFTSAAIRQPTTRPNAIIIVDDGDGDDDDDQRR